MTPRRPRIVAAVLGTVVAAILLAIAFQSTRWVGSTFPGFFVMANRVVPSIALGDWSGGNPWRLFQHQILAVDGIPVESADAVYRRVEGTTPGTPVAYTARGPEGRVTTISVPARVFTLGDYTQIFGAYFFNGFIFAVAGLLVFVLMPGDPAGRAFLCFGLLVGIFVITAGDLYGPARFFGLHVFAESLMGAAFVHLALVFPRDWIRRRRAVALAAVYAPALVLAAVYEAVRWTPSAYTEDGPPERITAAGSFASISATGMVDGTISL